HRQHQRLQKGDPRQHGRSLRDHANRHGHDGCMRELLLPRWQQGHHSKMLGTAFARRPSPSVVNIRVGEPTSASRWTTTGSSAPSLASPSDRRRMKSPVALTMSAVLAASSMRIASAGVTSPPSPWQYARGRKRSLRICPLPWPSSPHELGSEEVGEPLAVLQVRLPPRDRLHLAVTNREIERSGLAVRALYAHYVPRAAKTVDRGTRVRIAREPGGLL